MGERFYAHNGAAMATIAAVVPVKALTQAKTRLEGVLAPEARAALALWLLERVVGAIQTSGVVARVAVVSPDDQALARAAALGAVALRQEPGKLSHGLNRGLALGREWARAQGAVALLVALGDLPLLDAAEVRALVALADPSAAGQVVLAPDRGEAGTNLMLLRPPDGLPFLFGRASFTRHAALARERGLTFAVYHSPGTGFDLDWPADLDELRAAGIAPAELLALPGAAAGRRGVGDGVGSEGKGYDGNW